MIVWKVIMILIGVSMLLADFYALIYKKFSELMGMEWGIFSVFVILLGAVPGLNNWSMLMSHKESMAVFLLFFAIIINAFLTSKRMSQLSMKNQELAMQVSLLNQENERILNELERLTGKPKTIL